MAISHSLLLLYVAFILMSLVCSQDHDSDDLSSSLRFHEHQRRCVYRRQHGFCQRRSECNKPTRHVCRFGSNPVVCCLDEPTVKPTTVSTAIRAPTTTRKAQVKPDSIKEIDLTFPNCGFRLPRIQDNTQSNSNNFRNTDNGRGLFSRRGKRTALEYSYSSRKKRGVQRVIVGGVEAASNSWPWMVAILKETNARTPKRFLCGASLISQKYVLTAAHCFDGERGNIDPSKFFILVGSHTTNDGIEYQVERVLIHPEYKQRQYYNDISLLRIKNVVSLAKKIYPVCLPSNGLRDKILIGNNNVTVTGWGDTSFGGVSSKVLQELTIPIVPLKECNASYSKLLLSSFPRGITNLFICAGVKEGGKDACQGDSGGPLVSKLKDNSYVQLGVVSFGYGCAQAGFPGVYTRVSQHTKWLYDNTDLGRI